MAVALVGTPGTFAGDVARATPSLTVPSPGSAVRAGDVVFVLVAYGWDGGDPAEVSVSGFTQLGNTALPSLTNGFSPHAKLYVKESAGSEPSTYTISKWTTGGGTQTSFAVISWAVTGVDYDNLLASATPSWVGTAQSASQTLPSVTTTASPGMVIWLLASQRFSDPPNTTVSTPTGAVEIALARSNFVFAKALYELFEVTGSTGTRTVTIGPTDPGSPGAALGFAVLGQTAQEVEGEGTASLGGLSAIGVDDRIVLGDLIAPLGGLSATAEGTRDVEARAGAVLELEAAGVGSVVVEGMSGVSLGGLSVAAEGDSITDGTGSSQLGGLSATAEGEGFAEGTGSSQLGGLSATATGARTVLGSIAHSLGRLTVSAAGEVETPGLVLGAATAPLGPLWTHTVGADWPRVRAGRPIVVPIAVAGTPHEEM